MTKWSIHNQFRKAMKRRRERQRALEDQAARKLKAREPEEVALPETPEGFSRWYAEYYRKMWGI